MSPVDYTIIAILAVSAILGTMRGMLREAIMLVTWGIALGAGWRYPDLLYPYLGGTLSQPPFQLWAARALLFLAIMLLGTLVSVVAAKLVQASIFSAFNRFMGFVFGLLRGMLVIGLLVMLAQFLHLDRDAWWGKSKLLPFGQGMAGIMRSWVGENASRES